MRLWQTSCGAPTNGNARLRIRTQTGCGVDLGANMRRTGLDSSRRMLSQVRKRPSGNVLYVKHRLSVRQLSKHMPDERMIFMNSIGRCSNKALHSTGGLPVCSGCGKKFSKWQSLALHINGNSCTAMLTPAIESGGRFQHMVSSVPTTAQHICQLPEVSQASRVGINAFISLQHVLPQLLQTWTVV